MEEVFRCTNTRPCRSKSKRLSQANDNFIDMCGSFEHCQLKEKWLLVSCEELDRLKAENDRMRSALKPFAEIYKSEPYADSKFFYINAWYVKQNNAEGYGDLFFNAKKAVEE